MVEKFNLSDYTHDILKLASATNASSPDIAVQRFVENLATMKEHHKGCPHLNFHELGQQWNKLLSAEKVAQRRETLARMKKYPRAGGST